MTKIFLSYRRADSDVISGRIRDRLANAYGEKSVFMDIDNIPFGVDFRTHVKESLLHGDLLIAVIGPNWLGKDDRGRSRLEEESDPVRLELEAAIERKMPIIPVLVHNAKMPVATDLPPSLRDLAFFNAANVDVGRDFHPHMERLIRSISPLLKRSSLRQPVVWVAGLVALLLTAAAAFFFLRPPGSAVISKQSDNQPTVAAQTNKQPTSAKTALEEPEPWLIFRSHNTAELRSVANDMNKKGYQLRTINGYLFDGTERHAMLWSRGFQGTTRVGWEYQAGVYQKRQNELASLGFRPVFITAYESPDSIRYADVWTKAQPANWILRREVSAEELRTAVSELGQQGLHPVHIYGFGTAGKSQFVAIFERLQGDPNLVSIDTPGPEMKAVWDSHFQKGYRPKVISGYRLLKNDHLTILWEKGQGWASFGITEKDLDSNISQRKKQGLNLIYLNVYPGVGGLRHNMIWTKP
jgi:hypothetical protein